MTNIPEAETQKVRNLYALFLTNIRHLLLYMEEPVQRDKLTLTLVTGSSIQVILDDLANALVLQIFDKDGTFMLRRNIDLSNMEVDFLAVAFKRYIRTLCYHDGQTFGFKPIVDDYPIGFRFLKLTIGPESVQIISENANRTFVHVRSHKSWDATRRSE